MEKTEITVIDKVDVMSVEHGSAASFCDHDFNDYHHADSFVEIWQIEDPEILLRNVSLSYVTSLYAAFHIYGFEYFHGTLSVTFQPERIPDDVTTLLISCMAAGPLVPNICAKVLLLNSGHYLDTMWQLHMEDDLE